LAKGCCYLGADHWVRNLVSVGSNVVFVMCFGHYPLCVRLDWEELESKRLRRIVACGPDLQRNLKYVEMVLPHDDYLPKINTEEDGIIMTDGHDSLRAVFEEEFMPKNPSRAVVRAVPATAMARKVASSGGGRGGCVGGRERDRLGDATGCSIPGAAGCIGAARGTDAVGRGGGGGADGRGGCSRARCGHSCGCPGRGRCGAQLHHEQQVSECKELEGVFDAQ